MGFPLRFGIGTGNRRPFSELARQWQWIEELGFDTAWVVDHFMAGDHEDVPYFEAWTLIAALGMRTERIRFGVVVSGNTYRNPGLLAKEAVTIDHASNGRVELGIGAGWWEREHRAYSFPFPSVGDRIAMLEEAVQVIDSLMTRPRTTFQGRFYRFEDAPFEPKPVQKPRIPIMIGAFKPRMLRLAARYADIWNTRGEPEEVAPLAEQVRRAAIEAGRDPDAIRFSVFTWRHPFQSEKHFYELVLAYRRAGFTDLIFPMPPEEAWPVLERCARTVIPELRHME
ncbi:TIGR03560 family F420-dependent LLM class oxidoreductase [Thermomicrobiaceae bacterium CFH 74404]|uniref:TIGR03560 family F420-dependent LLM class oxidoreductase n=1 Tax=Thermalbibacter longus TaxID=2951981 RepID=A0AA41WEB8_9BACT|nr:TIGR03560 family F420-dependent LLM class oxidoreductase [Thermalbibacter longus]MCM8749004.1 TIGR03560 family F420-dependent LLM class oxidoreductase [Thermalbibacter longus]